MKLKGLYQNPNQTLRAGWLLVFLLISSVLPPTRATQAAQSTHQAGLVVDFGDGRVIARVVVFDEETISGEELLRRSGLNVGLTTGLGAGAAVCAIEEVGCPPTPQDCWCQCRGSECRYWNYFNLEGNAWVYGGVGSSDRRLGDGDVDGWVWGDGSVPPPPLTWDEILVLAQQSAPTATPPPPPPTALPEPTATSPTPSFTPTAVPVEPTATAAPVSTSPPQAPATSAPPTKPHPPPTEPHPPPTETPALRHSTPTTVPTQPSPTEATPAPVAANQTGSIPPMALAFGGFVVLLLAMWLWVRRRR